MIPQDDVIRIGDAERMAAQEALGEHLRAGRLDPTEYSDRVEGVALARTRSDLEPFFVDLPAPGPVAAATVDLSKPSPDQRPGTPDQASAEPRSPQPFGGRAGATLVAIAPIIALVVALNTGFWWAFFLVPAAGMLVWGDPKAHRYWRGGGCGYPPGYRHRHDS